MMKHLVFCFDGTWNKIDVSYSTNVARIAQSVSHFTPEQIPQPIYYEEGVGTAWYERWSGGILGLGLTKNITDAYHSLVLNYEPGDKIYVFGFSRGAFTARSFVGLIRNCGIMSRRSLPQIADAVHLYQSRDETSQPGSEKTRQFRLQHCPNLCLPLDREWRTAVGAVDGLDQAIDLRIEYLGVWDTVGALGVPGRLKALLFLNRKLQFHDTQLSSFVKRARHAVSADEQRRTFEPTLWSNLDDLNAGLTDGSRYEQMIFPGVHSGVGGGGPIRGLSDGALEWIYRGAEKEGLAFDRDLQSPIYLMHADPRAQLFNQIGKYGWTLGDRLMGTGLRPRNFGALDRRNLHDSLVLRYQAPGADLPEKTEYRPLSLEGMWNVLDHARPAGSEAQIVETKALSDPRTIHAPLSVRKYVVKPRDTLGTIAAAEMGDARDYAILFLHNLHAGILFDPNQIYVGQTIEIPVYPPHAPSLPADAPSPEPLAPAIGIEAK
jgi:uncharacterized protein (DUF2235 family)